MWRDLLVFYFPAYSKVQHGSRLETWWSHLCQDEGLSPLASESKSAVQSWAKQVDIIGKKQCKFKLTMLRVTANSLLRYKETLSEIHMSEKDISIWMWTQDNTWGCKQHLCFPNCLFKLVWSLYTDSDNPHIYFENYSLLFSLKLLVLMMMILLLKAVWNYHLSSPWQIDEVPDGAVKPSNIKFPIFFFGTHETSVTDY